MNQLQKVMWYTSTISLFLVIFYCIYSKESNSSGVEHVLIKALIAALVITFIVSPILWFFIKKNYFTDGANLFGKDAKNSIKPPPAIAMFIIVLMSSVVAFCVKYFLSVNPIIGFGSVFLLSLIILDVYNRFNKK
jgi:formate hydrogenlyase subunit 3/multisubunit Na+/H+ antiporter MnhD subunit